MTRSARSSQYSASTEVDQPQRQQPKQQEIEWRRGRVLELSSQGRIEQEIATILKVGKATLSVMGWLYF